MTAYYNEFEPKAAAWLRQLIKNGDIAHGVVDERSIKDVEAQDLRGFTQHHFFAGIGTWSYSLRNAGWTDDRPVCTASLPCQPFSAAGAGRGKDDERHLLPHFLELVKQCGFDTIIGEQVATAIKHGWLDDLSANMEREGYRLGTCVLGAHSVNSPHQRQRLYWVASKLGDTNIKRSQKHGQARKLHIREQDGASEERSNINASLFNGMADTNVRGRSQDLQQISRKEPERDRSDKLDNGVAFTYEQGSQRLVKPRILNEGDDCKQWWYVQLDSESSSHDLYWCRDGKVRPIKPGLEPMVNGLARGVVYSGGAIEPNNTSLARVVRLKGYGNAIQADTAKEFITAFMSVTHD